ncbi:hypothetical protein T06_8263 [Trichinella sp. T6]|nr:hypothetical protein T06_8263 [Trichinella sp. T6]
MSISQRVCFVKSTSRVADSGGASDLVVGAFEELWSGFCYVHSVAQKKPDNQAVVYTAFGRRST